MKIILLMGNPEDESLALVNTLNSFNYTCADSKKADEINQLGTHQGKVVVIFFDAKYSFKFLQENHFENLELLRILFVNRTPKITPDVQMKLNMVNLKIYSPNSTNMLLKDLDNFFKGNKQVDSFDDIQFSAKLNTENEK